MATLPMIFAFMVLAVTASVVVTGLTMSQNFAIQGNYRSLQARLFAQAGAKDALLRVVRDKNYSCAMSGCYAIDFAPAGCANGNDCAKVSVSAGVGSDSDPKVIVSEGLLDGFVRKIQVDVFYDPQLNGQIARAVWKEI